MRILMRKILFFLAFVLSGALCNAEAQEAPSPKTMISGQPVFAYSFLDLFPKSYTPPVTDQIVFDLGVALKENSINPTIVEFRKSKVGQSYPLPKKLIIGDIALYPPIDKVIVEKSAEELSNNAKYRIIVFPTSFRNEGAWRYYDITWSIVSIESGKSIWNYTYHGSHVSILSNSENKVKRSRKIVDAVIGEMKRAGII